MSYPSHFGNNFYPQSANEDFLNNLQLANDPLSSGVPSNTINFYSNNINDLTSTQYLPQSEIDVLQNETNKTQQPCIIDFYISNASPNINQSTILGIDNMKSLSQSMMSNRINQDNNITQSKINFSSTGDFLQANSMKTVSKDIIDKIASLGVKLDESKNNFRGEFRLITTEDSKIPVYVVPTNEELMIAIDTYELIK